MIAGGVSASCTATALLGSTTWYLRSRSPPPPVPATRMSRTPLRSAKPDADTEGRCHAGGGLTLGSLLERCGSQSTSAPIPAAMSTPVRNPAIRTRLGGRDRLRLGAPEPVPGSARVSDGPPLITDE